MLTLSTHRPFVQEMSQKALLPVPDQVAAKDPLFACHSWTRRGDQEGIWGCRIGAFQWLRWYNRDHLGKALEARIRWCLGLDGGWPWPGVRSPRETQHTAPGENPVYVWGWKFLSLPKSGRIGTTYKSFSRGKIASCLFNFKMDTYEDGNGGKLSLAMSFKDISY